MTVVVFPPTRRAMLGGAAALAAGVAFPAITDAAVIRSPLADRRVGIGYALWHANVEWQDGTNPSWGTPAIGYYRSDDPAVLAWHAAMLSGAGVDFVVVDWSNDLGMDIRNPRGPTSQRFIESSTLTMVSVWAKAPAAPRICIMIGMPGQAGAIGDGRLAAKADEVHALLVDDPARKPMLQTVDGKPLLLVYVGTPSPWQAGAPPWVDRRFEVRFVTGFIAQQPGLLGPGLLSRHGYWSWEDRGRPVYSVRNGVIDAVTAVAAWRGADSPGRDGGRTFKAQWAAARSLGPQFVLAGTFNEWWRSEQISPQASKDIEPSREFGTEYLDILRTQAALYKSGQ